VALVTFGLVGTIGLNGAWLYVAAGVGLLALALLIMEPEQVRIAQPSRRLESQAVSTKVNLRPRHDRGSEKLAQLEQTHSPSRGNRRTGEASFRSNPRSVPSERYEAEVPRSSPDGREHLARST
jgi:hypothetical protein